MPLKASRRQFQGLLAAFLASGGSGRAVETAEQGPVQAAGHDATIWIVDGWLLSESDVARLPDRLRRRAKLAT